MTPETANQIKNIQEPVRKHLDELFSEIREDKLAQISRTRKAHLYYQGKQYLRLTENEDGDIDWAPIDVSKERRRVFAHVDNLIWGDGQKFAAIMSQRRVNHRAVPDDPANPENATSARDAQLMTSYLIQYWALQKCMFDLGLMMWVANPVYSLVEYEVNPEKFGTHREPNIVAGETDSPGTYTCAACGTDAIGQDEQVCPACGTPVMEEFYTPGPKLQIPVVEGETEYDRGMVEVNFYGPLHVTTPFWIKSLKETPWLDFSQTMTKRQIKSIARRFGVRNAIANDSSSGEEAATQQYEALMELASPDGSPSEKKSDTFIYKRIWITPKGYVDLPRSVRNVFKKECPSGVQLHLCNGKLFHYEESALLDDWAVAKPTTDQYINSPAMCQISMSFQDYWNDWMNMGAETLLRGVPKHVVDSQILDAEAVRKSEGIPGELLFSRMGGVDLSKAVATLPTANLPKDLMNIAMTMRGNNQQYHGVRPEAYGGATGTTTWREANQKRNDALAQLQPAGDSLHALMGDTLANGVKKCAQHGVGKLLVTSTQSTGFETVSEVDMRNLTKRGWHLEAEENYPETTGQKIERLSGLAMENPNLAAAVGLGHPLNAGQTHEYFGIKGMFTPFQYERERVLSVVQKLLMTPPLVEPDMMTGQMIQSPAIMPDPFLDKNHDLVAEIIRTWCGSPAGRRVQEDNPEGFRHVVLYGQAQQEAAMAMMAPAGAPPPGGPSNEAPQSAPPLPPVA